MYLYRKAQLQRIFLGSILLGCAASLLSGMPATLELGAVQGLEIKTTA